MFVTLEMSLTVLEKLAPLEPKIRQRRKSLADEIGRAAESIALNVAVDVVLDRVRAMLWRLTH